MSTNGWGKGSVNNTNGWGAGAINNDIGWGDSQLKSWSGDTDLDGGTGIPVNTVAPVISGTTTLGSVLTTTNGTWTAKPAATFTYQWKRNGSNIIGATNSTHTLVNNDGATNIICEVTATNDFGSANATSNTLEIPAFTDADAQAFITAASITDPTQQTAINQLVTDLKGYGVWTKMKALYPFVGNTASQHKWNLKDPRDLDAAFRLVFNGGYTHNSNGITGNGTNAYADTKLIPLNILNQNSTHFSVYSRTNSISGNQCLIGSATSAFSSNGDFLLAFNNSALVQVNNSAFLTSSISDSFGHFIMNRNSSSNAKVWKNNNNIINASSNSTGLSNGRMLLNAFIENNNSISRHAPHNLAFASIGDGLTDTEAANFYTAVQTFQTSLNRQV